MADQMVSTAKPKQKRVTIRELVDLADRGEPPESELKVYELDNGRRGKKAAGTLYDSQT